MDSLFCNFARNDYCNGQMTNITVRLNAVKNSGSVSVSVTTNITVRLSAVKNSGSVSVTVGGSSFGCIRIKLKTVLKSSTHPLCPKFKQQSK